MASFYVAPAAVAAINRAFQAANISATKNYVAAQSGSLRTISEPGFDINSHC